MNDFNTVYTNYLNQIEEFLKGFIPDINPKSLYEPFTYIMAAGGKRIRPVLAMLTCKAVGGDPVRAIPAAAAIEILHNFTLVHDDIMDNSPIRRGKATIHKKWNDATAILTGDLMIGYSYKLLENYSDNNNIGSMLKELNNALIEVCEGQGFDMDFNSITDVGIEDYLLMIDKKTSKVLEAASVLGGLAGGGSEIQIESLRKFANYLGIAFQLQDDYLDLNANQAELGKTIGQDITEGKKTYMIIRTKQLAQKPEHVELINRFYESNGLGLEYVSSMREMMEELGVLSESLQLANSYFDKAEEQLSFVSDSENCEMLIKLIASLNKRKY